MPNNRSHLKRPRQPRKDNSILGGSNSALQSQPQLRYDIVKDWLEQTARLDPHPLPGTPQGYRKEISGNSFPYRPLDATSPYNKRPGRVDPRWSPRHDFPSRYMYQSGSPFETSGPKDSRKSPRRRTAPSDSSLISGFENTTKPPSYTPGSAQGDHVDTLTTGAPRDADLVHLDASSTTSGADKQPNFEKRPRRKTREDKYETKKRKRNREEGSTVDHSNHRGKKRKKVDKRKSMASSKNVMNNFTSNAVLNERITVQPHLKPGLFDNGRSSKKQPISDLTFSDMQFLKQQSSNIQPKILSKSRMREKRREDREMEEVSSFFLPHKADRDTPGLRPHKPDTGRKYREMGHHFEQFTPIRGRKPPGSSPPSHHGYSKNNYISQAHDETANPVRLGSLDTIPDEKDAGRDTTYLTWSSSRHSPRINKRDNRCSPNASGSIRTTIPESMKVDLITTGGYGNTRMSSYDGHSTEPSTARKTIETEAYNVHHIESEDAHQNMHQGSNGSRKVRYRDQAIMTEDPHKFSESAEAVQITEDRHASRSQEETNLHIPHISNNVDRQQIVREVRLTPIERGSSRQHVGIPRSSDSKPVTIHQILETTAIHVDQNVERRKQQASDEASVASRDAMPPPPMPHSRSASVAISRADVEFNTWGQNAAPANFEFSQVPRVTNHDKDTQDSRESLGSCSQALFYESVANNGHTLLTSNDVPWIAQKGPSVPISGEGATLLQPSVTPPTYKNQDGGRLSRGSYQRDFPGSQELETMAEFIARIENESQWQLSPGSYDSLGLEERALDPSSLETGLSHEQLIVYNTEKETPLNLSPDFDPDYLDLRRPRTTELCEEGLYIAAPYTQHSIGTPRILPGITRPLEEFEEGSFEMSSFWRPNQFSRF
ncbi:hypothetical protein F4813DRAFT_327871 [Daldinia decipiens]|uniref:uncharacterized protein n=1 Tax=Daldinia decipiens TaxID=326647 RepID=UPI0020C203E3|nr:uncharacterized protein F4813DRAFT_327871 [Daldinia decipiens]KAI1659896.1 hypothetical protein F4813DRAFT_327871 [Daldinia decipiens]